MPDGYSSNIPKCVSLQDCKVMDWSLVIVMYWCNNFYLWCLEACSQKVQDMQYISYVYTLIDYAYVSLREIMLHLEKEVVDIFMPSWKVLPTFILWYNDTLGYPFGTWSSYMWSCSISLDVPIRKVNYLLLNITLVVIVVIFIIFMSRLDIWRYWKVMYGTKHDQKGALQRAM